MDPPDRARCTPLFKAAEKGGVDTIQLLLQRGADVTVKSVEQRSVLHAAVPHPGAMELLLKVCVKRPLNTVTENPALLHRGGGGGGAA